MKSDLSIRKKKTILSKGAKGESFFIVAIGASAGGLEAVSLLLKNLPANTGMVFIYVQHLSPDRKSFLPSILSNLTKMKVEEIEDMKRMKPNHVYVIPYNKEIKATDGYFKLIPRKKNNYVSSSIDILFSSLAETHKEKVIGVVLSGNANDGTLGLKAIKNAGGLTIAQDDSAQASSMPRSAIATGAVHFVLSPKEIAKKLIAVSKRGFGSLPINQKDKVVTGDDETALKSIFELLHKQNGVDFSRYKTSTITRRLHHRMLQHGVKTIQEYNVLLHRKTSDVTALYKDLLIHVTTFFRDAEAFLHLKNTFLSKLLDAKAKDNPLRIWVPACSSGEEAYSIAILIAELQEYRKHKIPVQIFATDLSVDAIGQARIGRYSESDIKTVDKKRLNRFFTKVGDDYIVVKELRAMCVFSPHNILSDPPFSRMDFISCRNLLIYFDAAAQKKALAILYFALNEGGHLMLGKAETTGASSLLFTQVNARFRIYFRKKHTGVRKIPELVPRSPRISLPDLKNGLPARTVATGSTGIGDAIDEILLSEYMPACAVVNRGMEIIQFRGSTSVFLGHPSGKASLNILKMVRPEFAFELRQAIYKVLKTKELVRKSGIEIKINAAYRTMVLEVSPLKIEWDEPLLLIVFTLEERAAAPAPLSERKGESVKDLKIKKLTTELRRAHAEIHDVIESQETAYEELQAAHEEIVSTNEEFQSLNEELETSKEEIEATNEELISTNQELKKHNDLLAESYDYSQTIIDTIHEPMIILDKNLNVKSANKSFYNKFLVSREETEQMPLFELGNKQWNIPKLRELLKLSLSKNSRFENFEVTHVFRGLGEKIMLLNASRIIQKTHHEKLILLAIEDITERTLQERKEKEFLREDIRVHQEDKLVLEKSVSQRTKQLELKNKELVFQNKEREMRATELGIANAELAFQNNEKGKRSDELNLANAELAFQNKEKERRAEELSIANIELAFQNDEKGKRADELNLANIELSFQNKEKEKRADELSIANRELIIQNEEKERRTAELKIVNEDLTALTYISSHDLQEPLRKIQAFVGKMMNEEEDTLSSKGKDYLLRTIETAKRMQSLIGDLLTYSQTKNADYKFEQTDLRMISIEVENEFGEAILEKGATVDSSLLGSAFVIPFQFHQLLFNLISNSLKFSRFQTAPHIVIKSKNVLGSKLNQERLMPKTEYCHITYSDNGIGFDMKYKDRIFEVFQRLHTKEEYKGTGMGLAICKRVVENHRGIILATGDLNRGSKFDIYIPS